MWRRPTCGCNSSSAGKNRAARGSGATSILADGCQCTLFQLLPALVPAAQTHSLARSVRNLLLFCFCCFGWRAVAQRPLTPRQLYPGLFEAVQLGRVFPDNKTFVDMVPLDTPARIVAAYELERTQPGFNLPRFVAARFRLPVADTATYRSNVAAGLRAHLDTLWTVLRRQPPDSVARYSSLLPLPGPYLVPGGRFREVYYWDSYFTMLGLREARRPALLRSMTD
ncbi:MAG: hypothetical protein H7Z21_12035, partial [Hymenobacter sp.]|nr:hypothetical protein [Hymenobacter sp.]